MNKKENGTKSQLIWKKKERKIPPKQGGESYITLDENGNPIKVPEEAKEHITHYLKNIYQAPEGRPQFENGQAK